LVCFTGVKRQKMFGLSEIAAGLKLLRLLRQALPAALSEKR
jgi:hypothetical protein